MILVEGHVFLADELPDRNNGQLKRFHNLGCVLLEQNVLSFSGFHRCSVDILN
jgi:hypothetical protein